jgi:hypothetical protein
MHLHMVSEATVQLFSSPPSGQQAGYETFPGMSRLLSTLPSGLLLPVTHITRATLRSPARNLPEDHYGPPTEIREYSFFNNSKMTPRVRDDRVVVELCEPGTADCSDGREPAKMQVGSGGCAC